MTKTINAYKLRTNLGEYLNEVYYKGHEVIVERRGRPMVKIVQITPIITVEPADQKTKLLELAGSLPNKRAEEMKKLIYKTRKRSKQMIKL